MGAIDLRARDVVAERRAPSPPRGRSGRASCRCSSAIAGSGRRGAARGRGRRRFELGRHRLDLRQRRRRARSGGAAAARPRRRTPPRAAPRAPAPTGSGCGRAGRPCPAAAARLSRRVVGEVLQASTAAMPASRPPSSIVSKAPRRTTMYMRRGSMAIVVRRACLRQRQLRPDPARGPGGDRRRQSRSRRLLRRRRLDRAAARALARAVRDGRESSPSSTAPARTSSGCGRCCGPWQGVICAESAHLNVDECGAPEVMGGIKLLTVPDAGRQAHARARRFPDRAGRRRARRPAGGRVGHAVDRARDAVLARGAAGAARSRARARDAVPHRRFAAGQRRRVRWIARWARCADAART